MTSKSDKASAIERLRPILPPGSTVYCILRHVSRSGMQRRISFYAIQDGEPRFLDGYIGDVLGLSRPPKLNGLTVRGCGMDMGFHVVSELSYALFPKEGNQAFKALRSTWL